LLLFSTAVEVVGVAAVIPFLSLLTDVGAAPGLPFVGAWLADVPPSERPTVLRWSALAFAGLLMLANVLVMLIHWWRLRFSWSLNHALSVRLLRHYLAQPYARHLVRNTAVLENRLLVEVRQVMEDGLRAGLEIATRSLVILSLIAFLVVLDPGMALAASVGVGGSYVLVYVLTRRYLRRIGREAVVAGNARVKAAKEGLGGLRDLRLLGREAWALRRFESPSQRYAEVKAASAAIGELPRGALEALAVGGFAVFAAFWAGQADSLTGPVPILGAYAVAGLRLLPAAQHVFHNIARLRFSVGALEAVEADFSEETDLEGESGPSAGRPLLAHTLELRDVSYGYEGETAPALIGVSLTIERGRSLAVLGRTGAGKSTLVEVLLGLLWPQTGQVLLDGVPVERRSLHDYRRLFGYVPQDLFLLDDTVTRNVALGVPDDEIDVETVRWACAQAQVAQFIESDLPHGYDTMMGEDGVRLSGGQRQRIGIARALYHRPAVLVFDEATSALDVHTERSVYQVLQGIAQERTLVTITHRLESVVGADRVVVMDRGRVVDEGPPAEVLRRYRARSS